jgi:hypothetical protein
LDVVTSGGSLVEWTQDLIKQSESTEAKRPTKFPFLSDLWQTRDYIQGRETRGKNRSRPQMLTTQASQTSGMGWLYHIATNTFENKQSLFGDSQTKP